MFWISSSHCRTHNNLFLPENMARLSETYCGTHDLMDFDKKVVLGKGRFLTSFDSLLDSCCKGPCVECSEHVLPSGFPQQPLENSDVAVYKTNLERMQGFFTTVYDYR